MGMKRILKNIQMRGRKDTRTRRRPFYIESLEFLGREGGFFLHLTIYQRHYLVTRAKKKNKKGYFLVSTQKASTYLYLTWFLTISGGIPGARLFVGLWGDGRGMRNESRGRNRDRGIVG